MTCADFISKRQLLGFWQWSTLLEIKYEQEENVFTLFLLKISTYQRNKIGQFK